jgi:two-component system, chemotaxis family, sensor kinase CheA
MPSAGFVSLGTKLAAMTLAIVAVLSGFAYVEMTSRERQSLVRSKVAASAMVSDVLAASLVVPLDFGDPESIASSLGYVRTDPDVVYAVVRPIQGAVVASGTPPADGLPVANGEASREEVRDDRVVVTRTVASPVGKPLGTAEVHFSLARENAAYEASRRRILLLAVGFAVVMGALLIFGARRLIVTPLARLVRAARRLEAGDAVRVEIAANDEIGQLALAFNTAAGAIADREDRLASARARLQELFDHLRQGVLVFGRDGTVEGMASRQARAIFARARGGEARDSATSLEGQNVRHLLYGSSPGLSVDALAFDEWLDAAFDIPAAAWEEVAELAPPEVTIEAADGEQTILLLEFRPIARSEQVTRVMLLVTDETERRRLERTIETKEREHARQIGALRRLLAGGGGTFAHFLRQLPAEVARWRQVADASPGRAEVEALFRLAHTMKGEARTLELEEVEEAVARLEEIISGLAGRLRQTPEGGRLTPDEALLLRNGVEAVSAAASAARELFIEASPIGVAALDQLVVRGAEVSRLVELTSGADNEIGRLARSLLARPFGELVEPLREQAPFWAEAADKRVEVVVSGKDIAIDASHSDVLRGVITHLVRNAVAHGIERPEVRRRAGKPDVGTIHVGCRRDAASVRVKVEDDGGGFDNAAILARASDLGLGADGDATELAFAHGLSTAGGVGDLAGRGVGLAAVQADLRSIQWEVTVRSDPGKGTSVAIGPGKLHAHEAETQ